MPLVLVLAVCAFSPGVSGCTIRPEPDYERRGSSGSPAGPEPFVLVEIDEGDRYDMWLEFAVTRRLTESNSGT